MVSGVFVEGQWCVNRKGRVWREGTFGDQQQPMAMWLIRTWTRLLAVKLDRKEPWRDMAFLILTPHFFQFPSVCSLEFTSFTFRLICGCNAAQNRASLQFFQIFSLLGHAMVYIFQSQCYTHWELKGIRPTINLSGSELNVFPTNEVVFN